MKCSAQIAILMATYNGEMYLREQIESLLAQTCQDWHLYIHDDGSKDNTTAIIQSYTKKHADRITQLDYPSIGNACHNFLSMLEQVEAKYYMFCDQDDVWLSFKIEKTLNKIQSLEESHHEKPIIVHCDLYVTDAQLNIIDKSFIHNQQIKIDHIKKFEDYAATNTVTGCTMMFNQKAKDHIVHPYKKAIMHDAWICLSVSAANGIISFYDEPLILYRQHGNNTLGAVDMSKITILHKIRNILSIINADIRHYQEMNAIKPITILSFLMAKWRYKMN